MNLNKENIKKIRGLILFTIFVLVVLWNYELVFKGLKLVGNVILPFALGGAIAFVVNIPMRFFEKKIFGKAIEAEKKWAIKFARPLSLIITLVVVLGAIAAVMLIVLPELGRTILNLGKTIQDFIPQVQTWAIKLFRENGEIVDWISNINLKWDEILKNGVNFLTNGAGDMLDTTYKAAVSVVSGVSTFFIAFVFACYVVLDKGTTGLEYKQVLHKNIH